MRKIGFSGLLIMAALLLALAFPVAAAGPRSPVAAVASAAAVPAVAAMPQKHPHIHEALEAMKTARGSLEAAEHDFHGHRTKAVEHLNQAIREAEICEHEP